MKVEDLVRRASDPRSGSGKLPWHEPAFSARMLREHLSQDHGRASRRFEDIDRHVAWLHESVLGARPGRVLDLGCGPGLYTHRFAKLGHTCVGIDFSPASIAHAQAEASRERVACEYQRRDLLEGGFGSGFDAALLISGELNTFARADVERILAESQRALGPAGVLVLEVHPEDAVRSRGEQGPNWFAAERSLFSDEPHLCLAERRWDPQSRAATERFFILAKGASEFSAYASTTYAHSEAELRALLAQAGLPDVQRQPSLAGPSAPASSDFFVLICRAAR